MITPQIDRSWQNDRATTGCFREAGEKVVSSNDRGAMLHCPEKLFEILAPQRPAVLLFPKHDRVVEIKNYPAIRALKQTEFEFIEPNRLEKNDHVVPARLFQNAQPLGQTRAPRRQDCRFDTEAGIIIKTVP